MQIPEFIKELVWTFYPPRYKQLSEQPLSKSLLFMSKILLVAFLITGVLYLPKVALLKGTIEDELGKFDVFKLEGNVTQSDAVNIPRHNPWVVIDLNKNLTLTKEFFVIDKTTVQYRVFSPRTIPREQLKDIKEYRTNASRFFTIVLLLMLPGIALLLYLRTWLKYFFIVLVMSSFFFVITELTRHRLKWKEVANIVTHTMTPVILIEVISSFATTAYLLPIIRFLGINIYLVTTVILMAFTVLAIIGCQYEIHNESKHKK